MVIAAIDKNGELRGVVAIVASALGVGVLTKLAAGLSNDLPYASLTALRIAAGTFSILARSERLAASGPPAGQLGGVGG